MFTVTDAAKSELKRIFDERDLPPGKHLRLAVPPRWEQPGDFGIVLDEEEHGDFGFGVDGVKILLVDHELTQRLEKSVFDFKETDQGKVFTLDVY